MDVSIDLPLFNKGQVEKQFAEAEAARTRARRQVLESQILAEVRGAFDSLRLRREIAESYREQSRGRAEELREIADIGYQEGELGILERVCDKFVRLRPRERDSPSSRRSGC